MNNKNCRTLEKVLSNPPPNISWTDLSELLDEIAKERNCSPDIAPGGRILLTLRVLTGDLAHPFEEDTLNVPYSSTVYSAKARYVAEYLTWAGVRPCPQTTRSRSTSRPPRG